MAEPRIEAMTSLRAERRCEGYSWVALVGSRTIQAVSVSASQNSNRPSQVATSSRRMVIVRQPGNSGAGRACRARRGCSIPGGGFAACIRRLLAMDLIHGLESGAPILRRTPITVNLPLAGTPGKTTPTDPGAALRSWRPPRRCSPTRLPLGSGLLAPRRRHSARRRPRTR